MHTWMHKRNEKVHFLLRLNIGKKKLAACLLHSIGIAVVSECLFHLRAQYLAQSPDIVVVNGKHSLSRQLAELLYEVEWGGILSTVFANRLCTTVIKGTNTCTQSIRKFSNKTQLIVCSKRKMQLAIMGVGRGGGRLSPWILKFGIFL